MSWYEDGGTGYILGLAQNPRLRAEIRDEMAAVRAEHERTLRRPDQLITLLCARRGPACEPGRTGLPAALLIVVSCSHHACS